MAKRKHRAAPLKSVSEVKHFTNTTDAVPVNGLQGATSTSDIARIVDTFSNPAARIGANSGSLENCSGYELERWTLNYWDVLAFFESSWIARRIIVAPAEDIIKTWPKLSSDLEPEDLTRIDKAIRKTNTKSKILEAIIWARLFGGAGGLIAIDGHEHELDQPLKLDDIPLHGFKGIIPFDRWSGINPTGDVCSDISKPLDFGNPEFYDVRVKGGESFKVHCSRILRFTGPKMPEPENSAYSGWGISVLAPVKQTITAYDTVSFNALSLTFRANLLGMKIPDLAQLLSGVGSNQRAAQNFERRMEQLNSTINNQSMVLLPSDGDISQTQYSFAGMGEMMQMWQLAVSGAAKMPVTRLWGRTFSGLGQAGDGDEKIYEETISTESHTTLHPALNKLFPVVCMSELGEVPDDLDLSSPSIRVLDEKEKAELAKAVVDTTVVALNAGGISKRTFAKELKQSSDVTGIFTNITDEDIAALSDKVEPEGEIGEGLFGSEEGGLDPASGPAKALKEENHEGKAAQEATEAPEGAQAPAKGGIEAAERAKARDADGPALKENELVIHGLPIVIETWRGETRSGPGWSTVLPYDYGYFKGTPGADGDSLDAAVGPDTLSTWAYIFDQNHLLPKRGFDESKVFLQYPSMDAAIKAFNLGHDKACLVYRDVTPMQIDDFKQWIKNPSNLTKPAGGAR